MLIDPLLPRQCVQCPDPQPCNCASNQDCVQINRDCNTCSQTKCVDRTSSTSSSQGVSKGALAGGVIGALLILVIAGGLYFLYRRRSRSRAQSTVPDIKEVPASAETVLNRPDPADKQAPPTQVNNIRVYPPTASTNLDPEKAPTGAANNNPPSKPLSDPFEDTHSIQTAGTEGTNVIPIALIQPESLRTEGSSSTSSSSSQPSRPPRSPDLNLNLDHVNVSNSSVRTPTYARSTRSGVSRNSFMSGISYSSDFLEAPVIVTSSKPPVRQVLGVVKPQVITAGSAESLKPPSTRPANKSPLASSSFGPQDFVPEMDESQAGDPFDDEHSTRAEYGVSASPATTNFAQAAARTEQGPSSSSSNWNQEHPKLPWKGHQPSPSIGTQAGSVIDIGNATRVKLGSSPDPRFPYRTTMAKLVDPAALQDQRRGALTQAQVQYQVQNMDKSRRASGSSAISAASRAYSILESFPFVPPSPISDRPVRSPPRSPQNQQTFATSTSSPLSQQTFKVTPPSPLPQDSPESSASRNAGDDAELPAPPDRRTLGLSAVSTASSGLGSFPFQIETSPSNDVSLSPSVPSNGRQRASLDTLALTSDLSSYPLAFDRDSLPLPPPSKRI